MKKRDKKQEVGGITKKVVKRYKVWVYNEKSRLLESLIRQVSEGVSLTDICNQANMPSRSIILKWLSENQSFQTMYTAARRLAAELMLEETIRIADDASGDWVERENKQGEMERVMDKDNVMRSRLRVEARRWAVDKYIGKAGLEMDGIKAKGGDETGMSAEMEKKLRAWLGKMKPKEIEEERLISAKEEYLDSMSVTARKGNRSKTRIRNATIIDTFVEDIVSKDEEEIKLSKEIQGDSGL